MSTTLGESIFLGVSLVPPWGGCLVLGSPGTTGPSAPRCSSLLLSKSSSYLLFLMPPCCSAVASVLHSLLLTPAAVIPSGLCTWLLVLAGESLTPPLQCTSPPLCLSWASPPSCHCLEYHLPLSEVLNSYNKGNPCPPTSLLLSWQSTNSLSNHCFKYLVI